MVIQFYHNAVSTNCLLDSFILQYLLYFNYFFHPIIYMTVRLLFDGQETHLPSF